MTDLNNLLAEIDRLPTAEKWRLVDHILASLGKKEIAQSLYRQVLRESYGSLADDPIERASQPPYEERDPID